jgi:hypothetical protein
MDGSSPCVTTGIAEGYPMTGKKRALRSNLKKVDRHVIRPHEYDEVPELTDELMERVDLHHGDKLIRRGRPESEAQ